MFEDKIDEVVKNMNRISIKDFYEWLKTTDYFTAPASTKYHGSTEGGLAKHSFEVFTTLSALNAKYGCYYSYDAIAICGLFHDICKVNMYSKYYRNVKDNNSGRWSSVEAYKIDEAFPFGGHGSKSVYLLMKHGLMLTDEEATAINCHMGGWDTTVYHNPSKAYETYKLAILLHVSDMLATYINTEGDTTWTQKK